MDEQLYRMITIINISSKLWIWTMINNFKEMKNNYKINTYNILNSYKQ